MDPVAQAMAKITTLLLVAGMSVVALVALFVFGYMFLQWWRNRGREKYSLQFVHLLVALPKDNEIKIDAAEQMFAALHSLKHSGVFSFLRAEDHFAFEIIALHEEIRFYLTCPRDLRDFIEKQINGAYPGAEISEVDEPNIFSEGGKVSFASIMLKDSNHYPLKTFKDLPTDGLSLLSSALSKMQQGEGAILQFVIQPESSKWQESGHNYLSSTKKKEADPEKASYSNDPKKLDSIETKVDKP
ncbi:MAG TPA: hypothetical protein VFG51_01380, partial [Candidatus Saccharimonadia bacterium]|nr:hypothetical protein [Candidatus Saccharimonadia bacterium]